MEIYEYYYASVGDVEEDNGIETWFEEDGMVEEYWITAIDNIDYIEYITI